MDENKTIDNEYDLTDVIIGRPQEFKVGRKSFRLYPLTLAKMLLLKRQVYRNLFRQDLGWFFTNKSTFYNYSRKYICYR